MVRSKHISLLLAKPPPTCHLCHVVLTDPADITRGVCKTCYERVNRPSTFFKGVQGLPDYPIEKIARLPNYARELYEKHMTDREIAELYDHIRSINGQL